MHLLDDSGYTLVGKWKLDKGNLFMF